MKTALAKDNSHNSFTEILSWITNLKCKYAIGIKPTDLNKLEDWRFSNGILERYDHKYFSIHGVDVSISGREVKNWDQPIISPAQEGLVAFIVKKIQGNYHFLIQAKVEAGNFDIIACSESQCLALRTVFFLRRVIRVITLIALSTR